MEAYENNILPNSSAGLSPTLESIVVRSGAPEAAQVATIVVAPHALVQGAAYTGTGPVSFQTEGKQDQVIPVHSNIQEAQRGPTSFKEAASVKYNFKIDIVIQ